MDACDELVSTGVVGAFVFLVLDDVSVFQGCRDGLDTLDTLAFNETPH